MAGTQRDGHEELVAEVQLFAKKVEELKLKEDRCIEKHESLVMEVMKIKADLEEIKCSGMITPEQQESNRLNLKVLGDLYSAGIKSGFLIE